MIRILYLALVICSGVLIPILAEIKLHPNELIQEQKEDENFGVYCDVKDGTDIRWLDPRGLAIALRLPSRPSSMFVEESNHMMHLRFQPVKTSHAGIYTCVAHVSGVEVKKSFNLTVIRPIKFGDKDREYYAELGSSQVLYCEVQSTPPSSITWYFNDSRIEGDGYTILADGLQVNNVTEEKYGNYTCTASYTTERNGLTESIYITLKQMIPPQIRSNYKNDTVHGVINTLVTIRCLVTGDPWPEIKWMRKNNELMSPDYGANITNTPNGSILQFFLTSTDYLGAYTCKAANRYKGTSVTFMLEEGKSPEVPEVHVRDIADDTLRFDITTSNNSQDLNYRIVFKKLSEDDNSWKNVDFQRTDSPTDPYSINNLEPQTDYVYKVGACIEDDLCAFTNVTKITTQPATISATSTIHTVFTQIFILLPAFILAIMQRHRTT